MTLSELSAILRQMYKNAPQGEQMTMIHLFGIRYADEIRSANYTAQDIVLAAQIKGTLSTELKKGMNLARYVTERNT